MTRLVRRLGAWLTAFRTRAERAADVDERRFRSAIDDAHQRMNAAGFPPSITDFMVHETFNATGPDTPAFESFLRRRVDRFLAESPPARRPLAIDQAFLDVLTDEFGSEYVQVLAAQCDTNRDFDDLLIEVVGHSRAQALERRAYPLRYAKSAEHRTLIALEMNAQAVS